MSELRDARLRRALESAPDAHMRPDAKTRAAIRTAALGAVAPVAAPVRWWRTMWDGTGRRGPWNAAFATVLLASLVTVLWYDREVPDARTGKVSVASAPPVPSPPAAPPAAAPAPSPQPSRAENPVAARRETPVQAPLRKDVSPAPAAPAPAAADAAVAAAPATPSLQDQERRDLAKAQEPVLAEAPFATGAAAPMARSAPAAVAPAPAAAAAAPAPAPAAAAPAAAAPATRAAEAGGSNDLQRRPFESARLVAGLRSAEVPPAQSGRLVELAQTVSRAAVSGEPLAAPVTLRIELRQGTFVNVLEVAGPQVRSNGLTGRPDTALLQALQLEAERLLAR